MEPIIGVKTSVESGVFKEWTLVLHGTKTQPYVNQPADKDKQEKLYLVRRAHESGVVNE